MRQAIEDIELEIENLRAIISDLRPSLLDDLGLLPAIEALIDRRREGGLEITSELALPDPERGGDGLAARARDDRLPARPGGADKHRQARARASTVRVTVGLAGQR